MKRKHGLLRAHSSLLDDLFRISDIVIVFCTLPGLAFVMRERIGALHSLSYWPVSAVSVAVFLVATEVTGLYRLRRGSGTLTECPDVVRTWLATMLVLAMGAYATKTSEDYSRLVMGLWAVSAPLALCMWRVFVRSVLRILRSGGHNTRTAAVIGSGEVAAKVSTAITTRADFGFRFLGVFSDGDGADIAGTIADGMALARSGEVDRVYVAFPFSAETTIRKILAELSDSAIGVYLVPDLFVSDLLHSRWASIGDMPALDVYASPFYGVDGAIKRFEDILLGSVLLAVALLPMLVIAIAVLMTSRGPAFFAQRRYGIDGREIRVLKFRTMTVIEDGDVVVQTTKDDERVTTVGRFLRRYSLDELPQLLNVVAGNMSLVGPRPHAVAHNEKYRGIIDSYMLRHKVKPGMAGLAQMKGFRGETKALSDMERRVEYDLEYIRRWSLGLDVRILLVTIWQCLFRPVAY